MSWRTRLEVMEIVLRDIQTIQDTIAMVMPVYLISDVRLMIDASNTFQTVCLEFIEVLRVLKHVKSRLDLKFSLEPDMGDKISQIALNSGTLKGHAFKWLASVKASSPRLYFLRDEDVMRLNYFSQMGKLHDLKSLDGYINGMKMRLLRAWGHAKKTMMMINQMKID